MAVVLGGVETFDLADTGFAGEQIWPKLFPADAQRGNDAEAGYYDALIILIWHISYIFVARDSCLVARRHLPVGRQEQRATSYELRTP